MEPDPQTSAPRRVEAYLEEVLAPLTRRLSAFHRNELRRELRAHLWERVDAYLELGASDEDAVTEALRQFGGAEDFLQQWRREWLLAARSTARQEIWRAMVAGLKLSLPILLLACAPVIAWVSLAPIYGHPIPRLNLWLGNHSDVIGPLLAWADFVVLPVVLGITIGRRTPQRAGSGLFAALAAEVVLGAVLDGTGLKWWPQYAVINDIVGQAALLEFTWLPTACLAAALTGWLTRRRRKVTA